MAETKDILNVYIINPMSFVDTENQFMITESKFTKKLPAQMDLSQESLDFAENAKNTGKGMNGAIISNFLINLVFQGSL